MDSLRDLTHLVQCESLVHVLQDSLGTALKPDTHLLATRSGHKSRQFFIHMLRVENAPPSDIQVTVDEFTTDLLRIRRRKVEGIINEVELTNASFPSRE